MNIASGTKLTSSFSAMAELPSGSEETDICLTYDWTDPWNIRIEASGGDIDWTFPRQAAQQALTGPVTVPRVGAEGDFSLREDGDSIAVSTMGIWGSITVNIPLDCLLPFLGETYVVTPMNHLDDESQLEQEFDSRWMVEPQSRDAKVKLIFDPRNSVFVEVEVYAGGDNSDWQLERGELVSNINTGINATSNSHLFSAESFPYKTPFAVLYLRGDRSEGIFLLDDAAVMRFLKETFRRAPLRDEKSVLDVDMALAQILGDDPNDSLAS